MSSIKKAGIVCDNYKVSKFKEELDAKGYTDYKVQENKGPLQGTTTIQVKVPEDKLGEVKMLREYVEWYFKNRN